MVFSAAFGKRLGVFFPAGARNRPVALQPRLGPQSGSAGVSVVKPAHMRNGNDFPAFFRFDFTRLWSVLVQRPVWSCGVVIVEVSLKMPEEIAFVDNNDVVEQFAA